MLAILNKLIATGMVIAGVASLISCATESKPVSVVNDPDASRRDTAIPWNQQQKWEQGQEMGSLAEGTDRVH
jgi:hypothetical protein